MESLLLFDCEGGGGGNNRPLLLVLCFLILRTEHDGDLGCDLGTDLDRGVRTDFVIRCVRGVLGGGGFLRYYSS